MRAKDGPAYRGNTPIYTFGNGKKNKSSSKKPTSRGGTNYGLRSRKEINRDGDTWWIADRKGR